MDDVLIHEGIECAPADGEDKHFTCNDCFSGHVIELSSYENLRQHGTISCPQCETAPKFDDVEIARHVSCAAFDAYAAATRGVLEKKLVAEITEVERTKFEAELERMAQMNEQQREVHRHGQVLSDSLNLKCPRCKGVFLDFNGCAALPCSRQGCGAAFCAWCREDCGGDAHQHVARCRLVPQGANPTFPAAGVWAAAQKEGQVATVKRYLQAIGDVELRNQVALSQIPLLTELGIDVNEYIND
jgi:hypothetical protein